MRLVDRTPPRSTGSFCLLVLTCFLGFVLVGTFGCYRSQPTAAVAATVNPAVEETLTAAVDPLRRTADLESCRSALQQANLFLARHENDRPRELTGEEREALKNEFALDPEELKEVESRSFMPLDASYLESCFLLRDAARSLKLEKLPPLAQASAGFAWVMRQVRLREAPASADGKPAVNVPDAAPPVFVLRRGSGTALERSLVFLALLDEIGLDGCMVVVPAKTQDKISERPWVVGVLIGKEISLFDTRLGLPVPGPKEEGIATLAQIRTQPDMLHVLDIDSRFPYDVTPAQAKQAEPRIACQLTALAPRMSVVQDALDSVGDKIGLWHDPLALLQRFQKATQGPAFAGSKVRVWNAPGDSNNSLRVLRSFTPKDEGGADDKGFRQQSALSQLVPWQYLPRQVSPAILPGEAGDRLRQLFGTPFIYFSTKTRMPHDLMITWLPGFAEEKGPRANPELIQRGRLPRDLVLHGRYDEATTLLVAIREEILSQKAYRNNPELEKAATAWHGQAMSAYAALIQAQQLSRKSKGADPGAAAALENAKEGITALWKQSPSIIRLVQSAAAEPMSSEVTYQLALTKHEQAVQWQTKLGTGSNDKKIQDAWRAAASWWQTYLEEQRSAPAVPAARRLRAQALEGIGEKASARALLEDLSGDMSNLEKSGRLYLAKRLK